MDIYKIYEKLSDLYNKGLSDTEISEKLRIPEISIIQWRERRNLPKNLITFDLMALYSLGLTDKEMAKFVGSYPQRVQLWRRKNGLHPNKKRIRKFTMAELYNRGYTDDEIAVIQKRTLRSVAFWRRSNNLPKNEKQIELEDIDIDNVFDSESLFCSGEILSEITGKNVKISDK